MKAAGPCSAFPRRGLYAITGAYAGVELLASAVAAAMRGGAAVIQYRAKGVPHARDAAARLLTVCRAAEIPLIVNDDVPLAAELGADGVHLGRADMPLAEARALLGVNAIIGVSCYDSIERAVQLAKEGADYVAFGCFFPSRTKPSAPPARLVTLAEARRRLTVPIVAIGGVNADNGATLLAAGAGLLAVSDAVFGGPDPEAEAARFRPLFRAPA